MGGLAKVGHVVGLLHWSPANDAAVGFDVGQDLSTAADDAVAQALGAVHPELAVGGRAI